MPIPFPPRGFYAITDSGLLPGDVMLAAVESALRGGATAVQYRDKGSGAARRLRQAAALVKLCRRYGAPLIVNDDVELARDVDADGVHVGREDQAVSRARSVLGDGRIVGASCNDSIERALLAQDDGATYVAFGRFFPSRTKPDAVHAPLALLPRARPQVRVPIVAIGGITPDNGASLLAAGADILSAIDGVFGAPDVQTAARAYAALFTTAPPPKR